MKEQQSVVNKQKPHDEEWDWLSYLMSVERDAAAFESLDVEPLELSPDFQLKFQEAAAATYAIAKLRMERQRVGFVPLPLTEYLQSLVEVAGVSVVGLLDKMGIPDLSSFTKENARAFARFARALGMSLREALVHIRIGFAARQVAAPMPFLIAHRRATNPRRSLLDECEDVLMQIESEYPSQGARELQEIRLNTCEAYRQHEGP
jgi:hypothetical protein